MTINAWNKNLESKCREIERYGERLDRIDTDLGNRTILSVFTYLYDNRLYEIAKGKGSILWLEDKGKWGAE